MASNQPYGLYRRIIKEVIMEILFLFLMPVAIALAASKWGFDSRDGMDSQEWESRRAWRAFH